MPGGAGLGISWLLIYFTLVHFSFLTFWVRKWGLTISVLGWILNIWRKIRNDRGRNQLSVHTADVLVYILSNQMCSSNLPVLSSMNDLTKLSVQSTSLGPQYFIYVAVSELPLSFPCKLLTQMKLKWDLQRHSLTIRFLKYILIWLNLITWVGAVSEKKSRQKPKVSLSSTENNWHMCSLPATSCPTS